MNKINVALLPELSIECTLKAKDLYRIMPPDNKMRRRIVDASTVLGKAATALVEADTMLKVCRENPRAEDEDRIAELEVNLRDAKSVIANAILAYGEGATDSDIVRILKEAVTLEEARDAWNSLA